MDGQENTGGPIAGQPGLPGLSEAELGELRAAMARLERGPGLAQRLAEAAGMALGGVGRMVAGRLGALALHAGALPTGALRAAGVQERLSQVAQAALARAFDAAVLGVAGKRTEARTTGGGRARLLVAASGAVGGAAGLAGFAPDAAVTTLAIMRRIARIAQEEGEDLDDPSARRACLEVFALRSGDRFALRAGDRSAQQAQGEAGGGYFATRLLLQGGPLLRLLAEVAGRYGVQLGRKLAAQAVPLAGAALGAAVNAAFMAEYEGLARAHFTVRRLERTHGAAAIRAAAETGLQFRNKTPLMKQLGQDRDGDPAF